MLLSLLTLTELPKLALCRWPRRVGTLLPLTPRCLGELLLPSCSPRCRGEFCCKSCPHTRDKTRGMSAFRALDRLVSWEQQVTKKLQAAKSRSQQLVSTRQAGVGATVGEHTAKQCCGGEAVKVNSVVGTRGRRQARSKRSEGRQRHGKPNQTCPHSSHYAAISR